MLSNDSMQEEISSSHDQTEDDDDVDFDYGYTTDPSSASTSVFNDEDDCENGAFNNDKWQNMERLGTTDGETVSAASIIIISQDLLLPPACPEDDKSRRAIEPPCEQAPQLSSNSSKQSKRFSSTADDGAKKSYSYRLPKFWYPDFIRSAPLFLKMIITLSACVLFLGLCLLLGACLLQKNNDAADDDGNHHQPVSEIMANDPMLQWDRNAQTSSPTLASTHESLEDWAANLFYDPTTAQQRTSPTTTTTTIP